VRYAAPLLLTLVALGALEPRNQADYDLTYSMDVARIVVDDAASLLSKVLRLIG
jgi:hypothetical protein